VYRRTQRLGEAEKVLQEALGIRRKLAEDNPAAYLPDTSETLNDLGDFYHDTQHQAEAEKVLQEALGITKISKQKLPSIQNETTRKVRVVHNGRN
jgi:hypothetical protein